MSCNLNSIYLFY
uniref:Uncharacterized protein n=1 Tax=Anguilla anguilla TaxID=7936 RepID=A0A0E9VI93_ANGAN